MVGLTISETYPFCVGQGRKSIYGTLAARFILAHQAGDWGWIIASFESDPFPIEAIYAGYSACIGGPTFKTQIVTGSGGDEQRNGKSRYARRAFRLNTEILTDALRSLTYSHFQARRAQTDSFPFLDPFDHVASGAPLIAVSGGHQCVKRYTCGSYSVDRPITLLRSGTVSFTGGGSLNLTTGLITGGSGGTWSGEFYIPARYDRNSLSNIFGMPLNASNSVGIIEAWDSDIPSVPNTGPPARLDFSYPLTFKQGMDQQQHWSTRIYTTGWHEEREQDLDAERLIFQNAVGNIKSDADMAAIISLFSICRGRRSGFLYGGLDYRFGTDELVLEFTGQDSAKAVTPLVKLNAG